MKQLSILLTIVTALLIAACGGATNSNNGNRSNTGSTMGNAVNSVSNTMANAANTVANTASSLTTASPTDFMEDAAQGGMAEVELGKLAAQKAKDPEVKKFGQMMVDDHSKANKELMDLAKTKNFTPPAGLGSHQSVVDKLKGLSGADFDKAYVDDMVDDHETDVSAFEKQSASGSDPEVKAFAAKTLPTLKKHLEAIKAIQAKLSGSGSSNSNANLGKNMNHK